MNRFVPFLFASAPIVVLGLAACGMDTIPNDLRSTPSGPGAKVVWNATARPLPEIPIPNDVATFSDPTSRTGRRVNASLVASTNFERVARTGFDDLEGWGTFMPMSVQFSRAEGADPHEPAVDLANVKARMQGDDYAFDDDPIYVIDLNTGIPAVLDVGAGNFPVILRDQNKYWPNDPHVASQSQVFEDHEEGAGLLPGDYRPELDTDYDGVLDHPNTFGALPANGVPGVDNLLTWYERETDTLIFRPLLPLKEKTEYAVILTDRLRGSDGNPVKSPFATIYHPQQRAGAERVGALLRDASRTNYFGDLAGTGLDHVAFMWTFTTQPVIEDMLLLRDGLYGRGPFARFATDFPPKVTMLRAAGKVPGNDQSPGWDNDPVCKQRAAHPYSVYLNDPDVRESFNKLYDEVFGYSKGERLALDEANSNIDHVIVGTYKSPYLQGDPKGQDPDARFHVNFKTGEGDVRSDTVSFWVTVPKTTAKFHQPFPVSLFGHGVGGNASESLAHGGNYARNGLATVTINMPQHGLPDIPDVRVPATAELSARCLVPWVDAILTTRALDRNGDGQQEPGWWWWSSHIINVRDNVRQGTLDEMQFTRILRTFDGKTMSGQDYNGDGKEDLAGDFDGDGTPDIGGPDVGIYSAGESLGGIMSEVHGGIDHQVTATAPMSGGGGLTDIGLRSYGVTDALSQVPGPLVISIPATDRPARSNGDKRTNCSNDQRSVRFFGWDGDDMVEVELACLSAAEVDVGMTVVVTNLTSGEAKCAGTLDGGRFRVPVGASIGDRLDIQIFRTPNAVDSYGTCHIKDDAVAGRAIRTFEQKAPTYTAVAEPYKPCPDDAVSGCAQFMYRLYPVGSPLVAPQEGLGYGRNTPRFRRFYQLGQMGVEGADPVDYAPYYMLKTLPKPDGTPSPPHGLLNMNTVGDGFVNIATGVAFARAAGAVPFLPPSALTKYPEYADYVTPPALYAQLGNKTPNQVLLEYHLIEGIARMERHPAGPTCADNYDKTDPVLCPGTGTLDPSVCKAALADVDWLAEGRQRYDQQHPGVPLRLARVAGLHSDNATTLAQAWAPRLLGAPFGTDGAWAGTDPIVALVNVYLRPGGAHTWETGDACRAWDHATYGGNMAGHFLVTGGRDAYYLSHPQTHECLESLDCPMWK